MCKNTLKNHEALKCFVGRNPPKPCAKADKKAIIFMIGAGICFFVFSQPAIAKVGDSDLARFETAKQNTRNLSYPTENTHKSNSQPPLNIPNSYSSQNNAAVQLHPHPNLPPSRGKELRHSLNDKVLQFSLFPNVSPYNLKITPKSPLSLYIDNKIINSNLSGYNNSMSTNGQFTTLIKPDSTFKSHNLPLNLTTNQITPLLIDNYNTISYFSNGYDNIMSKKSNLTLLKTNYGNNVAINQNNNFMVVSKLTNPINNTHYPNITKNSFIIKTNPYLSVETQNLASPRYVSHAETQNLASLRYVSHTETQNLASLRLVSSSRRPDTNTIKTFSFVSRQPKLLTQTKRAGSDRVNLNRIDNRQRIDPLKIISPLANLKTLKRQGGFNSPIFPAFPGNKIPWKNTPFNTKPQDSALPPNTNPYQPNAPKNNPNPQPRTPTGMGFGGHFVSIDTGIITKTAKITLSQYALGFNHTEQTLREVFGIGTSQNNKASPV